MVADAMTALSPREQITQQVHTEATNEDLSRLGALDLDKVAAAHLEMVEAVQSGTSLARIRQSEVKDSGGLNHSILECAGRDMPFLVDSVLNACSSLGLEVVALFHPIVSLGEGQRISSIQVYLPRLSERESETLQAEIRKTLADVALAVADYDEMRTAMREEIAKLDGESHLDEDLRAESIAFLDWLASEHFVFLGKRTYLFPRDETGGFIPDEPDMVEGSNLGLLRDEDLNVLNRSSEPTVLTPEIGAFVGRREPIIIAKSTMISRVHRRIAADYVGIKHYDESGRVCGETRFLGLFTAEAYDETCRSIPLVRKRAAKIISNTGARPGGHDAKALANLIETWPRDELLQSTAETLTPMLRGALHLIGRPRTRLFLRRDEFNRFVTVIVYVPREAYDTGLRQQITALLETELGGVATDFEPRFDGTALARVTYHIRLERAAALPDVAELEAKISELAHTWDDAYRTALSQADLPLKAAAGAPAFRGAFNAAYREAFSASEALLDVQQLAELSAAEPVRVRAFQVAEEDAETLQAKIYVRDGAIPLSRCVPVFENMGLFVSSETGYPVRPTDRLALDGPEIYWVHHVIMRMPNAAPVEMPLLAKRFEAAFVATWMGEAENDGFNKLVFAVGATWREAALLRGLAAFRQQTGRDPARATQIRALRKHPDLTRKLLELFRARFDPHYEDQMDERAARCRVLRSEIEAGLGHVAALDDDRVIRRIADLIMAIQRTNFCQTQPDGSPKRAISFKIASQEVEELPAPKPFREIFVAGPSVEGVHCRFGPVARGGLRWSDRRDDFRTEVLGLVKAQQVKNAVIVPVGSKGGFYPKHLPLTGTRDEIREAGIAAYRTFITSLLDLTDNLVEGDVAHPEDTVIWDEDDPYLVVAADKGTATFSDIANEISESHGFWLGDAFASGGSAGYDHKAMGITARGGWEAVKRHFREMGKDIQTEPFTVVGVGDMAGDVFGNGMLLSKQIRLQAAFNHIHIFIDPDPADPERLWEERKRVFDLPRSTWESYDASLISEGGGIFSREAKSIPLNDQIRAMTGLTGEQVTPNELIRALLLMDAELLWFGGIGTYVKSSQESHGDVGDRANDGLRVDGRELNVAVVGEGANLGMTQAARVEFAQSGGRLNSDAIDNSAGVDSSDHEVNIKILAGEAIQRGDLPSGERNLLLKDMTDDVAAHVLAHNYDQTGALSLAASTALSDMQALERLMVYLEERGVLDRALEGLPDSSEMTARIEAGQALTRPELAVILAWSKITLFDDLVASDLPDDPFFVATLSAYFPEAIRKYDDAIAAHPLKREIISTVLANRLLDTGGPVFLSRLRESMDASNAEIARAFEIARQLFSLEDFEAEVAALDNQVDAAVQTGMRRDSVAAISRACELVALVQPGVGVGEVVAALKPQLDAFKASLHETSSQHAGVQIERRARELIQAGVPEPLARWSAAIGYFAIAVPLVELALDDGVDMPVVAHTFFKIGETLRLDRLGATAEESLITASYWDRVATRRMIDDLLAQLVEMTRQALGSGGFEAWLEPRKSARRNLVTALHHLGEGHTWSFSRFALSVDAVRRFREES
ncbi:MAG: NAD-glutamate dehydrogenase [Hyphomonadaceae bacterium]|nr:NAD-glutamate dehydrogenase [Hyphomonadaceae bacterium]